MNRREKLGLSVLAVWFPLMTAVLGLTMARHLVALPGALDPWKLERAVPEERAVVHVIPADCSCTDTLLASVLAEAPDDHQVVLVGRSPRWEARIRERGLRLHRVTPEQLVRSYGLVSGPVLVVKDGDLRYVGGYFDRPSAQVSRHARVLRQVEAGERPDPLPIFGCPVDPDLVERVDPLGILNWLGT